MNRKLSPKARESVLSVRCIHPFYFDEITRLVERSLGVSDGLNSAAEHSELTGLDLLTHKNVAAMAGAIKEDLATALTLLDCWNRERMEEEKRARGDNTEDRP